MAVLLEARAAELLKLLIERYVQDGQPVSSRTLSRERGVNLSPATIRNVMADLGELGFVSSPHTSAGRIPTQHGYRYFVDTLLFPESVTDATRRRIRNHLLAAGSQSPAQMVTVASSVLSRLSSMAGVVTVPRRNAAVLRRIDFLPLSDQRVLAILVVNRSEVQNRVIQVDREYSRQELEQFANLINQHYAGRDLLSLRDALRSDAAETQMRVNCLLRQTMEAADQALSRASEDDYVLAGGTNLLGFHDLADVKRLRQLFDALDRKRDLLNLFDQCLKATGVQIFIGQESGYQVLDECSVVTAPYYVEGEITGILAVIGPIRMAYDKIIPLVSETARLLSMGLKEGF